MALGDLVSRASGRYGGGSGGSGGDGSSGGGGGGRDGGATATKVCNTYFSMPGFDKQFIFNNL